jgi:uncharacterized protein
MPVYPSWQSLLGKSWPVAGQGHVLDSLYRQLRMISNLPVFGGTMNPGREMFLMNSRIEYYAETGKNNTAATLEIARNRALELGIRQILVASSHGFTALEAVRIFAGTGREIVAVTISGGYRQEGWCMTPGEREQLENAGVKVLTSQLSLSGGVDEAFAGNGSPQTIIANTLYCFSQGMKVACEIAIMAAEAGMASADQELIAVAGTGEGADTALVLVPAYARKFKELSVREILCKPRIG